MQVRFPPAREKTDKLLSAGTDDESSLPDYSLPAECFVAEL